jgi:hypothetical protein
MNGAVGLSLMGYRQRLCFTFLSKQRISLSVYAITPHHELQLGLPIMRFGASSTAQLSKQLSKLIPIRVLAGEHQEGDLGCLGMGDSGRHSFSRWRDVA